MKTFTIYDSMRFEKEMQEITHYLETKKSIMFCYASMPWQETSRP